ncbi:N,N-dimethylformamidase beta subunit family domain-containing protein [Yinghuangia seranimata]|uniref:N,N-dimethylformamidase beta subunit family domain-containing protein n=1 Tax=Yinghuangia seranimata TaxID=408067 RepID=UPI00248A99FA|nr:N,N-dimethylformamidase beta subunit family domain-containing protein [Yinghuangia seranimata]MDI2124536.1 tachylectin-related carbohydrate-binding protein [Yinghuangia seranimata]
MSPTGRLRSVPRAAVNDATRDAGSAGFTRRRVLQGATALAGAALLPGGRAAAASEAPDSADPEQSQLRMIPGGNGTIYSQQADGRLLWFRHVGRQQGTVRWAAPTGREIGRGWQQYTHVMASADGQLFGLCGDGSLVWHKYVLTDEQSGDGHWHPGSGNVVHRGFGGYSYVFGGWQGVCYAVDPDGDLHWFKYLAGDGTDAAGSWANDGKGTRIATGRRDYDLHFADQDGVIYGVRHGASLDWFRYTAGDGTNGPGAWANDGRPIRIGDGWEWGSCVERFADAGSLYCVWIDRRVPAGPDHELRWYGLSNWRTVDKDRRPLWANGNGALVGTGFTVTRTANLQGYADRWSVANGQSLAVSVSSSFDRYQATVLRLDGPLTAGAAPDTANSRVVSGPTAHAGRLRKLPADYRARGCGWPHEFSVTVADDWRSGFHVVQLTGDRGLRSYVPFVVRPPKPVAKVAVMLPFLTHSAYNHWGGHFQYSWDAYPHRRTHTMLRPFANAYIEPPGHMDVRFYGDLLLLRWLADNDVAYDCYQDLDLHNDGAWLGGYKALVLASHPEYWTAAMRSRLEAYLTAGGRVIYTGGNAMYERVEPTEDGTALTHRNERGDRWLWRDQGKLEKNIFGVAYNGASFMEFAPYEVLAEHPFLAGTGLKPGARFGHTGYNFAASGWEVDTTDVNGPALPGVHRIAHGTQKGGSHMVLFDRGNGGWVFAAGSLSFNGALAHDRAMSTLLHNALHAAVQ